MNRQNTIIITIFASFVVFIILVSPLSFVATIQAQARPDFIIMKVNNPSPSIGAPGTFYHVYNMTANLNKFLNNINNKTKVEFKQNDIQLVLSDRAIDYTIPFNIIDTSTPNIIRSKPDTILLSTVDNYTKEVNTLNNVTTYTGQSHLFKSSQTSSTIDVNIKAVIYPNGTGIVYTTER